MGTVRIEIAADSGNLGGKHLALGVSAGQDLKFCGLGSSPTLDSELTTDRTELAWDSLSLSLSAPPHLLSLSRSLSLSLSPSLSQKLKSLLTC